jgi:hypothetical protein
MSLENGTAMQIQDHACTPSASEGAKAGSERETLSVLPASRFAPVPIRGEPLSATIIRDRGER